MQTVLQQAELARQASEVPIGAALFFQGQLISRNHNHCHQLSHPLQHAEFLVLQEACQQLSQSELRQSILFVTLEPCPMCMGAILHSHLGQLAFGAYNLKWGACGTVSSFVDLFPAESIEIWGGIQESQCISQLNSFFQTLRHSGF